MRSPNPFLNKSKIKSSIIRSAIDGAKADIEMEEANQEPNSKVTLEQQKKLEAMSKSTGLTVDTLRLIQSAEKKTN